MNVSNPDAYVYMVDGPSFLVQILMLGGIFALLMQNPYMMTLKADRLYLIRTSKWNTSTLLTDKTMTLNKSDITSASFKKIGPANWFKLKMADGSTKH